MTSVWAESARLPFAIFKAANRHARQLGRAVVSDDLFLLALTELDEDQPARRALAAAGVSSERLLPNIRTTGDAVRERLGEGLHYAPAYYTLQGLAQGFAATLGDGVIAPEHVLLAIQWTGNSHSLHALHRLGVTREAIIDELRALGVAVPQAELPTLVEVEWGEKVWFERDRTREVLDHVRLHLGPGTRWGFNYEGDRAWIRAECSVDIDALVRGA